MADDHDSVVKHDLLKKVKTNKFMYFVLHKESVSQPARLEYYDSKKVWEQRKKPKSKRVIYLRTCFSVNQYSDSKVKYGLTLYTREDSLQVSFEQEEERDAWLNAITDLIRSHRDARPLFPFVWDVRIRDPSLGKQYEGDYRLCLNDQTVILVKEKCVDPTLIFPLEVIRRCGHTDQFFNLEVGRQASTGAGEFWMEVSDEVIAQNVHLAILVKMEKPKQGEVTLSKHRERGKTRTSKGSKSGDANHHRNRTDSTASRSTYAGGHRLSSENRCRTPDLASSSTTSLDRVSLASTNASLYGSKVVSNSVLTSNKLSSSQSSVNSFPSVSDNTAYADMTIGSSSQAERKMVNDSKSSLSTGMGSHNKPGYNSYLDMDPSHSGLPTPIPELPASSQGDYLDMAPNNLSMSQATPHTESSLDPYIQMTYGNNPSSSTFPAADTPAPSQPSVKNPYIDMTGGGGSLSCSSSSVNKDVCLRIDTRQHEGVPLRHYSVGSRPTQPTSLKSDQYVVMCCSSELSDKDKSSSVPHLSPIIFNSLSDIPQITSQPPQLPANVGPVVSTTDYERPRTSSDSLNSRPRVASWSQLMRPRSSSHDHKPKAVHCMGVGKHWSSKESIQSASSDYIDMHVRSKDKPASAYVEMNASDPHHHAGTGSHDRSGKSSRKGSFGSSHKQKTHGKSAKHGVKNASDRSGLDFVEANRDEPLPTSNTASLLMQGRRMSQPHKVAEPFPELSASSEEELSMRSGASSFSSGKSNSSSRSSLARGDDGRRVASYKPHPHTQSGMGNRLDGESYVDCQQNPSYRVPNQIVSLSNSKLVKPERVTSFISEESSIDTATPAVIGNGLIGGDDYAQMMSPLERRSSKSSLLSTASRASNMTYEQPSDPYLEMSASTNLPRLIIASDDPLHPQNDSKVETNMDINSVDSYMEMAVGGGSQLSSNAPNMSERMEDSYVAMVSTQHLAPSHSAEYLLMSLSGSNTQPPPEHHTTAELKPDILTGNESTNRNLNNPAQFDDPYMDMVIQEGSMPAAPVSIKPPPTIPVNSDKRPSVPVSSFDDPYMSMMPESQLNPEMVKPQCSIEPGDIRPLPNINSGVTLSENDTMSAAPSDITLTTAETNSSSDSNMTLIEDTYPSVIISHPKKSKSHKNQGSQQPKRGPPSHKIQTPICYVRQDSRDVLPTHSLPTTCYIRNDSSVSQQSSAYDPALSPTSQLNILDQLAVDSSKAIKPHQDPMSNGSSNRMTSVPGVNVLRNESMEPNLPLSPISFPANKPFYSSQRSWSSSGSRETDIPQSAAELEAIQKQKKQHSVFGDGESGGSQRPPASFIKDDIKKPLSLATNFKKPTDTTPQTGRCLIGANSALYVDLDTGPKRTPAATTPPVLAPRKSADDATSGKIKRNSSDSQVTSMTGSSTGSVNNTPSTAGLDTISPQPIHYAELDHSRAPTSPTIKTEPTQLMKCSSNVDYTPIDHKQTEALAKKKP